ncbi:putative ribonuclease H-like domain-containing protein [Tanacetum coccineum]|uniref:Ribonuclease H-like domain-containing protein n=1 Tax=Tanacetum coccineum TaxID=301880 RepID=A0ABQ5I1U3_9ASTR
MEKIFSEKKDLADSYLDEIVCLKNANKVARDMLQRFNMLTQTIPMLSKKPKAATLTCQQDLLGTVTRSSVYIAKASSTCLVRCVTLLTSPSLICLALWDSEDVLVHQVKELSQEQALLALSANENAQLMKKISGFIVLTFDIVVVPPSSSVVEHVKILAKPMIDTRHDQELDCNCDEIMLTTLPVHNFQVEVDESSKIGINKWSSELLLLRNFNLEVMEFESAHSNTTAKLPMLKLGDYEITREWYFSYKDVPVPVTAKEKTNKKNDVKARSLLLMALPNEHQLTFSQYNDAKTMSEDFWMNKPEIETMSIDDLYNNFKIVEQKNGDTFPGSVSTKDQKSGQSEIRQHKEAWNNEDVYSKAMLCYSTGVVLTGVIGSKNSEEVAVLKREVSCKDYEINMLKSEFEKVKKEKEGIEFKIEKFDNASKSLNKLLESQITDKSKKGLGYNAVPPPHPLIYNRPKKLDLSYSSLNEFKDPEFKSYGSGDSKQESNIGKPLIDDKGYVESGCSRHMTGNITYLSDFKEFDRGYVTFGRGVHGGRICVSQMCDKKNYVLFTDIECLVLSPNFKLLDETQILLKIPRKDNMYNFDMMNIVPKESLTCLVAKATLDESMLWHRRLGHINFKNINKLVKDNLVRGLPRKHFEMTKTCVDCLKGSKQSFLCSFLAKTKDETSEILKNFIKEIENLVDKKVKITRCDNGIEFKNKMTLIEAARTILADSKLPTIFWAEAVGTACYVQNRVLVVKPHNKTPYELFRGLKLALKFMRPFGYHVTILNTLDNLGKFDGKSNEGTISNESASIQGELNAGTSTQKEEISQDCIIMPIWKDASYFDSPSKDVGNGEPKFAADDQKQVKNGPDNENDEKDKSEDDSSLKEVNATRQHVNTASPEVNTGRFKLNTIDPSVSTASSNDQDNPKYMFKMGASHTLEATHVEFFSDEDEPKVDLGNILNSYTVPTTPNTRIHKDHPIKNVIGDVKSSVQTRRMTKPTSEQWFLSAVYEQKIHDTLDTYLYACFLSQIKPTSIAKALSDSTWVEAMQEELLQFKLHQVWILVDLPIEKRAIGTKWVFRNKKDERGILIRNKARTIEKSYYVTSTTRGFKDPDNPEKVYKVVNALYGLHQVPRACMETWLLSVYVELLIIFGSTTSNCVLDLEAYEDMFQDSYLGPPTTRTYFNFLVVLEKPLVNDGDAIVLIYFFNRSMFVCPCCYLSASRPDIMFALVAYTDSDYAGATQDRKSTTGGCQFLGNRLISWQCKKQTVVATSTTEAEYVAAASCCGQVLWIQNQLLDYGYNFMNTVINIDNNNLLTKGFDAGRHVKRGRDTKIPQSSSHPVKVSDDTVYKELGDRTERAATTDSSLEAEQDSGNINRTQSMATLNEQSPSGTGSGSGPRCQDTILGCVDSQTRFETTSKQSNDLPLSRVNTLGSRKDNMKLMELMAHCTDKSKIIRKQSKASKLRHENQKSTKPKPQKTKALANFLLQGPILQFPEVIYNLKERKERQGPNVQSSQRSTVLTVKVGAGNPFTIHRLPHFHCHGKTRGK